MYSASYGFANPGGPAAFNTPPPQQMQQPQQGQPQQQLPPGSMPGQQPQQMMYGQQFGMPGGQAQFMAGAGNPNIMGSPGPGMMPNPGMPHMAANGQMGYQAPYTGSPYGVGMPASAGQPQMPPNFNMMAVPGQMPGFSMTPQQQQQQAFMQQQQQQQQQQRMQPPQQGQGGMPNAQRQFNPMQQGSPMPGMSMSQQQQMQQHQMQLQQQQQQQHQQQQQQHLQQQQGQQQHQPSQQPPTPSQQHQPSPQQMQQPQMPPQQSPHPQQMQNPQQQPPQQQPQQAQQPQAQQQSPFGAMPSPRGPPQSVNTNAPPQTPLSAGLPSGSTPQTPTFPSTNSAGGPMANGVSATTPAPPLSPGSENREKEIFSTLLSINQELLLEAMQLRHTQLAIKKELAAETGVEEETLASAEITEPGSEEEQLVRSDYIQCMKRIQANLSCLASLADRKVTSNAAKGPFYLSAPGLNTSLKLRPSPPDAVFSEGSQDPNVDREERIQYIRELYSKLQSLYPGVDATKEPAFPPGGSQPGPQSGPGGAPSSGRGGPTPPGGMPGGMHGGMAGGVSGGMPGMPGMQAMQGVPGGMPGGPYASNQGSPPLQRTPQMGMMPGLPGQQGVPMA